MPMLGAANRQEDRYTNPNAFDIFRQAKVPISWGMECTSASVCTSRDWKCALPSTCYWTDYPTSAWTRTATTRTSAA